MSSYLDDTFDFNDMNLVSVYDEFPLWSSYFGAVMLDMIEYRKNLTVLDIGCGTGFPLIELAQRLGSSSHVYGIDPWEAAAGRIKFKIDTMNLSNVTFLNQPAENLPFEDKTFDLVVSNNGINNVQDAEQVLSEIERTLKPGASFIMSVNLPGTMTEFYDLFKEVLDKNGLKDCIKKTNEHIKSKRKSIVEYTAMIMKRRFCMEQVVEKNFIWRFADGIAFLNHYFIKMAFLESWKKIVPDNLLYKIFNEVEVSLNKLAEEKGQLNLTIPFAVFSFRKMPE